mmetsp:Transcript_120579/g.237037  ORF Transcript_120579/g.237037 Transcript_120579/m.237037 type:complete len:220 (+) Transcript_120579:103-762(+)
MFFACCCESEPAQVVTIDPSTDEQASPVQVVQKAALTEPKAPPPQPPAAPRMFEAQLAKVSAEEKWGLNLEVVAGSGVWISMVNEDAGAASRYNKRSREEVQIRAGDAIVQANGERQPASMSKVMQQASDLALVVKRPQEFDQSLKLNGKLLGLEFNHQADGQALYVKSIAPDSAASACGAGLAVGDRIVAVNGRRGAAKDLLDGLKSSAALSITIARL